MGGLATPQLDGAKAGFILRRCLSSTMMSA